MSADFRKALLGASFLAFFIFSGPLCAAPLQAVRTSGDEPAPHIGAIASQTPDSTKPLASFMVQEIRVQGNTLLSKDEIKRLVSPYEGHELTLDKLSEVAAVLTQAYRRHGYLFAQAHLLPQKIQNGIVVITVLEGRLGHVRIEGAKNYSPGFIRYFLNPLIKEGTIDYDAFEKTILLLNEFPDLSVESYLSPGKELGTADVVLKVADKTPLHVRTDYNNFGNPLVGRNRGGLAVTQGNLTGRGDALNIYTVFPFPSEGHPIYQASYSIPISPLDTQFIASYASADVNVGGDFQVLDIRGEASIYGFTFYQPLQRAPDSSTDIYGSVYLKTIYNVLLGSVSSRDKLQESEFSLHRRWSTPGASNVVSLTVDQGLGTFLGGQQPNDPAASRPGSTDAFTKLGMDYTRVQAIFHDNYLVFHSTAQWGLAPLPVTEQYSLGGPDSVRGYEQSEFLGDSGYSLSTEWRFPLTRRSRISYQGVMFLDTGYAAFRNPSTGSLYNQHLMGTGIGLRVDVDTYSLRVDLGLPLDPANNSVREFPVLYLQSSATF